ncbi:hypothetical protein BC374_27140 [Ensifer sp. LC13]|nr:hypothetical protein BBX50_27055 [Ensifer sp. LC11]OCP03773.1 hypothetical protein BC374_27140 [Ensifer sp. LC13]OCP08472.1 hypothetical protein BC362_01580 [Ensifer sp. LC14]OCP30244.1 hypothetical protein BC364_27250 [Ensifer sp. LC499]
MKQSRSFGISSQQRFPASALPARKLPVAADRRFLRFLQARSMRCGCLPLPPEIPVPTGITPADILLFRNRPDPNLFCLRPPRR